MLLKISILAGACVRPTRLLFGATCSLMVLAFGGISGCVELRLPDPAVRYVAFGDSATNGPADRNYPDILRERLGADPAALENEGVSGETVGEGLERLGDLFADGLYPNAETLLYWEGGNDVTDFLQERDRFLLMSPIDADYPYANALAQLLDEVEADLAAAVSRARNEGLEVYIATYFHLRSSLGNCGAVPLGVLLPGQAAHANEYVALLNQRIRRVAEDEAVPLVDIELQAARLLEDGANYIDCNHLDTPGNAIAAEQFLAAIEANTGC